MQNNNKLIFFEKYCPTCKYEDVEETNDPCNECLFCPVRENTHKPDKWEEKDD